jgi:hypothetical protein
LEGLKSFAALRQSDSAVTGFRKLAIPVFLAAIGCGFVLTALSNLLAQSQSRNQAPEKLLQLNRAFRLTKFYNTPNPFPVGKPGDLIRSQDFDEYSLPINVDATRILYHSRSATGQDVAASGVVLYPHGKPPADGWPVIAWAHGLNGVARQCAPSLTRNMQHGPFLAMYVGLGWAVVATDYTGLGTSFRNAFSDVQSNATDVIYSVPAARSAVPHLNSRWVAVGIAHGGSTVAAVAELEHEIRDPNYLGGIVISELDDLHDRFETLDSQALPDMPLFLVYGIKTIYPEFDVGDILTDKALRLYPRVEQSCADPRADARLSPAEILKLNWQHNHFVTEFLSRNTLGTKPAQGPVLVIRSQFNSTVLMERTAKVIARMCRQKDTVDFERYPQSDSGSVFGDSVRDQIAWIQARFAGRPATSNCPAQP